MIFNTPEYIAKKVFDKLNSCIHFPLVFMVGMLINIGQFWYQGGDGDTNVYLIFQPNYDWECMLGRWMIQYIGKIRNDRVIPILVEVSTIAILSVALILILDILNIRKKFYVFLSACLYFGQPFVCFILHIYYCSDAYALSLLFATFAAWILLKIENRAKYFISIVSIVISLSLYQSCIVVTGILILIQLLKEYLDTEKDIKICTKKSLFFLLTGIVGIIFYILFLKQYLIMKGLSLADYKGMSSMGQLNISESLFKLPLFLKTLYFDSNSLITNYSRWVNGRFGVIINIFFVFGILLYIIKKLIAQKITVVRVLLVSICVFLLPIMWGIVVFMAPQASIHVLLMPHQALLYIYVISAVEETKNIKHNICQIGRWPSLFLIFYIVWNYYLVVSEYQYGLKLADNKAYALASEINLELRKSSYWECGTKIAIIGKPDSDELKPEYYKIKGENEMLFWDGYPSQQCWQKYMLAKLGMYYTMVEKEEYNELIKNEQFQRMAYFPQEGSIQKINDAIVIKLGDNGQ